MIDLVHQTVMESRQLIVKEIFEARGISREWVLHRDIHVPDRRLYLVGQEKCLFHQDNALVHMHGRVVKIERKEVDIIFISTFIHKI